MEENQVNHKAGEKHLFMGKELANINFHDFLTTAKIMKTNIMQKFFGLYIIFQPSIEK